MAEEEKGLGVPFDPIKGQDMVETQEQPQEPQEPQEQPTEPQAKEPEAQVEPKEEPKQQKDTEPSQEPKAEEPQTSNDSFDISFFNKAFNTEFEKEDDIKNLIESTKQLKEYEEQVSKLKDDYGSLSEKYEAYKKFEEGYDPLENFASPEDYKAAKYRKEHPDKDPGITYEAFTSDLSEMGDLDLLVKFEKFNDPSLGGEAEIREMLANQYGIDPENMDSPSEWSNVQKTRLKKEANLARKDFNEMRESVEVPEKVDINALESQRKEELAAKKETLKKDWTETVDILMDDMNDVTIYDEPGKDGKSEKLVDFVLDDKMKGEIKEGILEYLVENGKEVNEENIQEAGNVAQARVVLQNQPRIIKAYANELLAKQEADHNKEIHNPEKTKDNVKPSADEDKERIREAALGGIYPEVPRRKMF